MKRFLAIVCCVTLLFSSFPVFAQDGLVLEETEAMIEQEAPVETEESALDSEPESTPEPEPEAEPTAEPEETEAPQEIPAEPVETAAPPESPETETQEPAVSLALIPQSLALQAGETFQFAYELTPPDTEAGAAQWSSSDAEVLQVDEHGCVAAVAPGEAILTLTLAEGLTANASVIVEKAPEEDIFSRGYAYIELEEKDIFQDAALQELYFALHQDDVLFVLSRDVSETRDLMEVAVATQEGIAFGWTASDGIAPMEQEAIQSYLEPRVDEEPLPLPEDPSILLYAVEVEFALVEEDTPEEAPVLSVESFQAAPYWSGLYPQTQADASLLARSAEGVGTLSEALLSGLASYADTVDLSAFGLTPDELLAAYQALLDSHLDLFYVAGDYLAEVTEQGLVWSLAPSYLYDAAQTEAQRGQIQQGLAALKEVYGPAEGNLQKLYWLYLALGDLYNDASGSGVYGAEGFFAQGGGESQSVALVFQLAAEAIGVPVVIVRSEAMGRNWNMVQLGGDWYHVDVTAYHMLYTPEYLMVSDAYLSRGDVPHTAWTAPHAAGNTQYDGFDWNTLLPMGYGEIDLLWEGDLPEDLPQEVTQSTPGRLSRALTLEDTIAAGLRAGLESITITSYQMHIDNIMSFYHGYLNLHPEFFYMTSGYNYYYSPSTGYITSFIPYYSYTGQDRLNRIAEFENYTNDIISAIPSGATPLQQALFVNDYFAANYKYSDYGNYNYKADILFSDAHGVCQAYALAYQHIMNQLGIPSRFAISTAMNHAWNVIQIDGNWYHVDVTWNDPTTDLPGRSRHAYFMLSDDAFGTANTNRNRHYGWDLDTGATDTTYDSYFWETVNSPFAYLDGYWYTVRVKSGSTMEIIRWDGQSNSYTSVYSYTTSWSYTGCYSGVIAFNGKLYYNNNAAIYSLDVSQASPTPTLAYTPTLQDGYNYLYGLFTKGSAIYHTQSTTTATSYYKGKIKNSDLGGVDPAPITVTSVYVFTDETSVLKGNTVTLKAAVLPWNADNKSIVYTSSNTAVATVSASGVITGVTPGTATITATSAENSAYAATCAVEVLQPVESITWAAGDYIYYGTGYHDGALADLVTVLPANAADKTITWRTSSSAVAYASGGRLYAAGLGTCYIYAFASDGTGLYKTQQVQIVEPVTSITLDASAKNIAKGQTTTIAATTLPSTAYNHTVTWASSDESVATVSSAGVVTALDYGTATITATSVGSKSKLTKTCVVTVIVPVTGVQVTPTAATVVAPTGTQQLTATILPANATTKTVTWASSDTSVATVSSAGLVTGKKAGTATITATSTEGGHQGSAVITVTQLVTGITLSATTHTLDITKSFTLTHTALPTDATNKNVNWTSSNTAVATVSTSGVVTGVAAGSATITATAADGSGKSASCTVTVPQPVTSITLSASAHMLDITKSFTLTYTALPTDATNKNVNWTSSNTAVATVSTSGVVTGIAAGTATITATAADGSGKYASCTVTVVIPVTGVQVTPTTATVVAPTGTQQLTATILPANATTKTVTWASSDTSVATVSSAGLVTGKKAGTATITATSTEGGHQGSAVITVTQLVTGITLSATTHTLDITKSFTLTHTALPTDATNKNVNWTSSNTAVATVSTSGVVTGVAAGSATITATAADGSGKSASCTVTVVIPVTGVQLAPASVTVAAPTGTKQLAATIAPSNATVRDVIWSSSDSAIATVSTAGVVTGKKAGTATITVTTKNGGFQASTTVTVTQPATGITLAQTSYILGLDKTHTLSHTVLPADATNKAITWSSSDSAIATVSAEGLITPVAEGVVAITATTSDGGHSASCQVTVKAGVTAVALNVAYRTVKVGGAYTLKPTIEPATAVDQTVVWTSSDSTVAKVSQAGVVTGVKKGKATITATTNDGGFTAKCVVYVGDSVKGIAVSPTSKTIKIGTSTTLKRTFTPASPANTTVTWKSSNTAVATVSASGVVKGVGVGTATITVTAQDGSFKATSKITVGAAVTSVKLNTTVKTIKVGGKVTLKATVSPSNAAIKTVTWKSSNTKIAKVSTSGVVTGVKKGAVTITATTTDGKKVATCKIYVGDSVKSIKLNVTSKTIKIGASTTLKTTFTPTSAANKTVTWKSSNTKVATVSSKGVVKGVGLGTATITVTTQDGSYKKTCKVTVGAAVTSVKLNLATKTIKVGGSTTLKATVSPSNAAIKTVTWKSSNTKVATVSSKGVVKGIKKGSVTITATTTDGKKVATCKVYVGSSVTSVKLNKTAVSLKTGGTYTPTATVSPSAAANKTVTWKSSNTAVATVSSKGVITAKKAGTATITVTTQDASKKATIVVTVKPAVTAVTITPPPAALSVDSTYQLSVTVAPATAPVRTVTWSSSNTAVATVSTGGMVTAVAPGTVTITATSTDGGITGTCQIVVE